MPQKMQNQTASAIRSALLGFLSSEGVLLSVLRRMRTGRTPFRRSVLLIRGTPFV